jgi:type III restriction enzyme
MNEYPTSLQSKAPAASISAPQGDARTPKRFQTDIINGITSALQRESRPPCLLRSPTGSGKTYMLAKVLQRISAQQPTLWLWFVPYVTLVAQTIDALVTEGAGLTAKEFSNALNEEPAANLVLLSTAQGVASAKGRASGYTAGNNDTARSIAPYLARAKSMGLQIGLVVDEAHIALKSTTEFGEFAHWVQADYFLMASATPRDAALNAFIEKAGYGAIETFTASRADVVKARLNKQWIQAVVYNLRESMLSVTDLDMTVLRRAWRQNRKIERDMRALGLKTVPLMLVQVANGDEAIREAFYFLTKDLGISPDAIGMHEAADPDPEMMAAIANDTRRQVLIFKQSAGTGFDAPRAFVLASTKHVNDADFATQSIGRIMRVPFELQQAYPDASRVPPELDTAYVFLANAQSQPGFAEAAAAIKGVKSQLSGQTEELYFRRTAHGGVAMTNRPTDQTPLIYNLGLLRTQSPDGTVRPADVVAQNHPANSAPPGYTATPLDRIEPGSNLGLFEPFGDAADDLDTLLHGDAFADATASKKAPRSAAVAPASRDELFAALEEADLRALPRRTQLASHTVPQRFMTEVQPMFEALALDVNEAARNLHIDDNTRNNAVKAALNRMNEKEIRTELFGGDVFEEDVQVITDQDALLEHTREQLATLGLEDQDATDVIQTLAMRLIDSVEQAWALQGDDIDRPTPAALRSQSRQAACWVIHKQFAELQEALHSQWATRAKLEFAQPLPDALLLPAVVAVLPSRKNIYGVLYPSMGVVASAREALAPESRKLLKNETYVYGESAEVVSLACVDGSYEFNDGELKFAKALDLADFVEWWHRNPHSKPFSVGLLRGDSKSLFYPDFVVCMTHMPGDEPLMRLIDPKHDTKDASRKAIHTSSYYGKVLFLTKDASRFKIVNDDGSVGDVVDFDDLSRLKTWMRGTQPIAQNSNQISL